MANRFITFLETIGKDFENGLAKIAPAIAAFDPALGAVFSTVVATVSSIEQKFTAMNKQTGSGPQKLAEAVTILQPVVSQAFAAAGKASDTPTVTNYINAVVGFLNAIPAAGTATPPAAS